MKTKDVLFVRVYVTESSKLQHTIITYLQNDAGIHGISVFRAILGYGSTGKHTASFMDVSLDLPLAIEFFDTKEKVQVALEHLNQFIKPDHIVFWDAKTCEG